MNLLGAFQANVARRPSFPAVRTVAGDISFAALDARGEDVAGALRAAGIGPGDRVAVQTPNRPEFADVIIGLLKTGAVLVPVSFLDGPEQVGHIVSDSEAKVLFFDPMVGDTAAAVAEGDDDVLAVCFDGADGLPGPSYHDFLAKARPAGTPADYGDEHTLYLGYTSGSTGTPKGVVKSHRSIVQLGLAVAVEWGLRPGFGHLVTMPMCHSGGLWQLMFDLCLGITAGFTPSRSFEPDTVLELLTRWQCNWSIFVPTMSDLLLAQAADGEGGGFPDLEVVCSGSAPMFSSTKEGLLGLFPHAELNECYGATETGVVTNLGHADQARKTRCVGRPILGVQAKVVGPDNETLLPGEVGELVARSPYLLDEYYRLPDATAAGRRPDGFFGVGDLATTDDEGYFYIVDRKNDMIITGGLNVYPAEVEEVLKAHPAVADAIVVGLPHDKWGEQVTAAVVAVGGADVSAPELVDLCKQHLSAYKV